MTDDLLGYFNRELSHLRAHAARFADAHPKVASRLRLGADGSEDPHVERLLQGFAYLTAGLRQKLDDGYAGMAETLLGVLYPHYLNPIPSAAIVQFDLDPGENELAGGLVVPRGEGVETEPIQGEPCRFRTVYPATLLPIDVSLVELRAAPFTAPPVAGVTSAAAALRIRLTTRSGTLPFSALGVSTLRLYLHGQSQVVNRLYELLFRSARRVAFATSPDDRAAVAADPTVLRPVGFDENEGLLPYPQRSLPGYRLLTEFFAFPRKFHFVDVVVPPAALARAGRHLELFVYLDRAAADLEPQVTADTFRLGCTPVVNLYTRRAEPIRLTHTEPEYRVVPDVRRPLAHEVYSVDRVSATGPTGEVAEWLPLYGRRHGSQADNVSWHARRVPAPGGSTAEAVTDRGTDVTVAVVDRTNRPAPPIGWTVHVETTCLNRDLPARLPFGGGQPRLQFVEGGAAVSAIRCLTPPTLTLRPKLGPETLWRLVSHLTLNHLSLAGGADAAGALREYLTLYDFADRPDTRAAIDAVVRLDAARITGRLNGGIGRGVEVTVTLDEERFAGRDLFLFGAVLDRFFPLQASLNTFTRTVAKVAAQDREYHRWPTRAGNREVL